MSHFDHALMTDRLSTFQALARRQQLWAEVRRGMNEEQRRAPGRIVRAFGSLRLRARRSIKGRRSLA